MSTADEIVNAAKLAAAAWQASDPDRPAESVTDGISQVLAWEHFEHAMADLQAAIDRAGKRTTEMTDSHIDQLVDILLDIARRRRIMSSTTHPCTIGGCTGTAYDISEDLSGIPDDRRPEELQGVGIRHVWLCDTCGATWDTRGKRVPHLKITAGAA